MSAQLPHHPHHCSHHPSKNQLSKNCKQETGTRTPSRRLLPRSLPQFGTISFIRPRAFNPSHKLYSRSARIRQEIGDEKGYGCNACQGVIRMWYLVSASRSGPRWPGSPSEVASSCFSPSSLFVPVLLLFSALFSVSFLLFSALSSVTLFPPPSRCILQYRRSMASEGWSGER